MIIGIDLGTTFSVIAVSGRVKVVDGYPEPQYIEKGDVSIVPDPFGNFIIPSAVWEDPDQPGQLIVGVQAKEAADEGHSPIMFSKRNIGTNILHPLGERQLTARETAKEILIYLKGIAEEALGERIDRAVITHPAYFDPAMKEETAKAAQNAGFDFDPEKHLLMEPIAAALTYTRTDTRDPLRILTYDLGGGTFDVTVMERRKGAITIKAFGGNRLLGGFNFDRELAHWLLRRLQERGVRITLNDEDPDGRGKWARLMRVAEDTKIKLAKARTAKMPVQIREQAIFEDDQGRSITLQDQITREQFVELIQDLLDETITGRGVEGETKGCNITLAEAGLTIEEVDEIVLVGGSSWGPWVVETLQNIWGREALHSIDPDLCVAAGAAIHATTLPEEIQGATCRIELDVDKQTVFESPNIAGRVLPVGDTALPSGLQALLTTPTGKRLQAEVNVDGHFLFEEVELQPESTNRFGLTVADSQGRKMVEHHFEIIHTPESDSETVGVLTVLPKPLFIEVLGGMKPLAEEGATLPAHREVELTRTNDDDTIEIRLFQEADLIGSVVIEKVPPEVPIGAKVKLAVEVSRNNRITGRASVLKRREAVAVEAPVDIRIPPMQVPDLDDLRAEFEELEYERAERMELELNNEVRMTMQAKGDKLSQKITKLLDSPSAGSARQEIWLALRDLKRVAQPPKDDMEPPLDRFESLVLRIKEVLSSQASDPQVQAHTRMVERLENEGRAAHSKKDRKTWAQVNASLENLLRKLVRPAKEDTERETLPTSLQKLYARMQLDQTRQFLRAREAELMQEDKLDRVQGRVNRLREQIDAVETEIDSIDDDAPPKQTENKLRVLFLQKVKTIEDQIPTLGVDVK